MRLAGGLGDRPRARRSALVRRGAALTAAKKRAERMVKMMVNFISKYQARTAGEGEGVDKEWTARKPQIGESIETWRFYRKARRPSKPMRRTSLEI